MPPPARAAAPAAATVASGRSTDKRGVGLVQRNGQARASRPGEEPRMRLTARQMLLRREAVDVAEAVRRVVALQAQEAASPYLALWNRLSDFDPADLDAAFAGHAVVKATLMRITLHAVHAGDYPAFRSAMLEILRGARLYDRRFTATGLSGADADALVPQVLDFVAERRTTAEVQA